jgi:hypothetical protein
MVVRGYRKDASNNDVLIDIFDIVECTYTGKDMGERSITATFYWPSPIDFKIGDYVELQMQSLVRGSGLEGDISMVEKFYIYTMPTIKKTARPMEHGQGFEHTVVFYPAQYELGLVQMRDMGTSINSNNIIYSGFDSVSLHCGANELMQYIMQVLKLAYHDSQGNALWSYRIADSINESKNTALERFPITFSSNTVMDAVMKLSDKEGINTTFFINDRTIYVGYKRPYFCRVTDSGTLDNNMDTQMFNFKYGKTSHESTAIDYGCLYDITKSVGKETPITKLFAYGAARNLNRYYCSDMIGAGRYVNRLMLPSFSADGVTDYILSENVDTYGIREGSKQFEDIYPSLQYVTYGDIRQIQYCIKIKAAGHSGDNILDNNGIARVQCYRVMESPVTGVNTLVEAAPPDDIAVYVHALGKVVKVVLYGGPDDSTAIMKQLAHDKIVPTRTNGGIDYIPGSCFLVHDDGFLDSHTSHLCTREQWFTQIPEQDESSTGFTEDQIAEIYLHQINYSDTFWLTDLYKFTGYGQTVFDRKGYSAYAYPKLNGKYVKLSGDANDSLLVNEIVAVEPVVIEDTSANIVGVGINNNQQTFDLYLRDVGFKIDEQNDFGESVFAFNGTLKISILDGDLAGQEFEVAEVVSDSNPSCVCAFNEDCTLNPDFFDGNSYTGPEVPQKAFDNGAIWRLRCIRTNTDAKFSNMNIALPNSYINAKPGDHLTILDIFMPDIYILAAENRLLREARKYLRANDKGSVAYNVNLDAVRMQQVPAYALQMREGLNIRMVDDDLGIVTENRAINLFNGSLLCNTSMMETTYDCTPATSYYYEITTREHGYVESNLMIFDTNEHGVRYTTSLLSYLAFENISEDRKVSGKFKARVTKEDYDRCLNSGGKEEFFAKDGKFKMRWFNDIDYYVSGQQAYALTDLYFTIDVSNLVPKKDSKYHYAIYGDFICDIPYFFDRPELSFDLLKIYFDGYVMHGSIEYSIRTRVDYDYDIYTPNTHLLPIGSSVYAPSKVLVEFTNNKHYEVVIEAYNASMLYLDDSNNPLFVLLNNLGSGVYYQPDYTVSQNRLESDSIEYTISFDLKGFNDSIDYYPALLYISDNATQFVTTKLISITESDFEGTANLNYADFTVQDVSIKITDSTNRSFSQPIKEITAKLSEQSSVTAWASLMNTISNTRNEGAENARITQEVINSARNNYQALLNLRNSIFDPDGTCTNTFLQVMMLQVGADSMNYQLNNTRIGVDGTRYNCFCGPDKEDGNKPHFKVYYTDILNHFVYTSGSQAGTWRIPKGIDVLLDGTSTYYVSLKCKVHGDEGEWVCETTQRKVNEDPSCWYFNWGILNCDSTGVYTMIETRGNAYMYGDNLVCGRISNLAKNCWFDLTKGEFVLGKRADGTASLSYENGMLTINGLPDENKIAEILADFDSKFAGIGGTNLLKQSSFHHEYKVIDHAAFTELYALEANKTYIATYGKFENNANGAENEQFNEVCLAIGNGSFLTTEQVVKFGEPFSVINNGRKLYIVWCNSDYADYMKGKDDTIGAETTKDFTQYLDQVMLQEGTVATAFQPAVSDLGFDYLKEALQSSTEIAGGLLSTTLINLRGKDGQDIAGLSGINDISAKNYGVTLWSGGTYLDALAQSGAYAEGIVSSLDKVLPILLTKAGIGSKVGCFEIESANQAAIYSSDRDYRILLSAVDDKGCLSIKLQQYDNNYNNYEDKVVISNQDVDTRIKSKTIKGYGAAGKLVSAAGDAMPDMLETDSVVLDNGNWKSNITSGNHFVIKFGIKTGYAIRKFRFGPGSVIHLERFVDGMGLRIYTINVAGEYGTVGKDSWVSYRIPIDNFPDIDWEKGTYRFVLYAQYFVRTNGAGIDYTMIYSDDTFIESDIYFSLENDLTFTSSDDGALEPMTIIGRNGLKINTSSSSNFIVKNGSSNVEVIINGLPTYNEELTAGQLYRDGNQLMII